MLKGLHKKKKKKKKKKLKKKKTRGEKFTKSTLKSGIKRSLEGGIIVSRPVVSGGLVSCLIL